MRNRCFLLAGSIVLADSQFEMGTVSPDRHTSSVLASWSVWNSRRIFVLSVLFELDWFDRKIYRCNRQWLTKSCRSTNVHRPRTKALTMILIGEEDNTKELISWGRLAAKSNGFIQLRWQRGRQWGGPLSAWDSECKSFRERNVDHPYCSSSTTNAAS